MKGSGRRMFDQKSHDENDPRGREAAKRFFAHFWPDWTIKDNENKTAWDLKVWSPSDNINIWGLIEVECRSFAKWDCVRRDKTVHVLHCKFEGFREKNPELYKNDRIIYFSVCPDYNEGYLIYPFSISGLKRVHIDNESLRRENEKRIEMGLEPKTEEHFYDVPIERCTHLNFNTGKKTPAKRSMKDLFKKKLG